MIIGFYLIPSQYGIISFAALWSLYGGLINPGVLDAAQREIPYLLGKKMEDRAQTIQNISISFDFLWSLLPFLVIFAASFFYTDQAVRFALWITAANFIVNRFVSYWDAINFAKQRFTLTATARLIGAITLPLITIALIYWLRMYAVLLAPIFSALFTLAYFLRKGPINFRFNLDLGEVKKLIRVGAVLSLLGLLFYVHRMLDRTLITSFLPMHALGLFSFAMAFVLFAVNFLADFGRVLGPMLWKSSGEAHSTAESFMVIKKVTIYFSLLIAIGIPLLQIVYAWLIPWMSPNYINSTTVFNVLSLYIFLATIVMFPSASLNSSVINKQNQLTLVYAIGIFLSLICDLYLIFHGYGIIAISCVTVATQCIITFSAFGLAKSHITKTTREFVVLIGRVICPFVIVVFFTVFNSGNLLAFRIIPHWVVSLICQLFVWMFIIVFFYRPYFSRTRMVSLGEILFTLLPARRSEKTYETLSD